MSEIILKANINECTVENWQSNTGEVNARVMNVEMSEDLLTCDKQFVTFELADGTVYESLVVDGKAKIPIFEESQFIKIGAYAENIDGDECNKRFSAHPANVYVNAGSFKGKADEQPKPTPGDYADLLKEIEDIKNTGGGSSGDGCGITVVDDLDLEKEYGAKEVPSMNNFADKLSILSEISASLMDVEKLKAKDIELSDKIDKNKTDITQYAISELSRKQNNLVDTASVGQTVRVKDVDANGKPIDWEPVDFPAGGSGGEEWEPILAKVGNSASGFVNICNFEGVVFENAATRVTIPASGTVKVVFNLPVKFKKIFAFLDSTSTPICTSGNVRLSWDAANSNYHHFTELDGASAWKGAAWHAEFKKACVIHWYNSAGFKSVNRLYAGNLFDGTNKLTLSVVSADSTFNDFNLEIWGVRA